MSEPLLESRRQAWPTDWAAIFGRSAPLCMEIGFGNGQFLVDLAKRQPQANVLGIEVSMPSQRRALRRVGRQTLSNIRVLSCDARYALWALCAPKSVTAVYINFPDPWPKAAHHQRRLVRGPFLQLLATRMKHGAVLEIATDHEAYARHITNCLLRSPSFESQSSEPYSNSDPHRIQTKYERTALANGRICHYFKWRRNQLPAVAKFSIPKELTMPHVILGAALDLGAIAASFEPMEWRGDGVQGRFLDVLQSLRHDALLFDVYISEEPLSQRVALSLRPRQNNLDELILGVHELGLPRPTTGVHQALAAMANWLASLGPEFKVLDHNLQLSGVTITGSWPRSPR